MIIPWGKEERLIAGKEFTGRDKKVAKMTREGLAEENLRDGTVKDISYKSRGRPEDTNETSNHSSAHLYKHPSNLHFCF